MKLGEKVAYLKGLAQGMEIGDGTKEGKLLTAIIDTLGSIAAAIDELEGETEMLNEYVNELDSDLGDVEQIIFEDDEDFDDVVELECPNCGEVICVDDDVELDSLKCPKCLKEFEFKVYSCGCGGDDDDCPDECDCGCKDEK